MRRLSIILVAVLVAACSAGGATPTPRPTLGFGVADLIAALSDADTDVRLEAAQRLAGHGNSTAVPALVDATEDPDLDVARAALDALAAIGGPAATDALLAIAATVPAEGDFVAAGRLKDAVKALGKLDGDAVIGRLLELSVDDNVVPAGASLAAADILETLDESDVPAVAVALAHEDQAVRLEAIKCLGRIGGADAAAALIGQVTSKTAEIREAAIGALGDAGDPSGTAVLVKALDDAAVRTDAAISLAQIHAADATPLLKYLKAKATVRVYLALIRIGKTGTEPALVTALNKFGYVAMAEDYLNCGNDKLDAAARTWASKHGYTVYTQPGSGSVTWGR